MRDYRGESRTTVIGLIDGNGEQKLKFNSCIRRNKLLNWKLLSVGKYPVGHQIRIRRTKSFFSVAELLKMTGEVNVDPKNKGVFDATKKNWDENYLDIEQFKVKKRLEQYNVVTRKKVKKSNYPTVFPLFTVYFITSKLAY